MIHAETKREKPEAVKIRPRRNWELLFRNTDLLRDLFDRHYPLKSKDQITIAQIKMLICVMRHEPEGVMLKEIVGELDLTPGAVSQMVEHLVRMELLERCASESDRRAVCIKLSGKGKDIRAVHEDFFNRVINEFMETVPEEKREVFSEVLRSMHDYLENEKMKQTGA